MWRSVQLCVHRIVYSDCRCVSGVYCEVRLGYCGVSVVVLWSVELFFEELERNIVLL